MSRVYEQKQARAAGNRLLEAHYREMSYGALRSEIAAGRLRNNWGQIKVPAEAEGRDGTNGTVR
jgi:hypothetical protein